MDLQKMWKKNNKIIILAGFAAGLLHIAGVLPETLNVLEDYTIFLYGGLVGLGAFSFYKFYWNAPISKPKPVYDRHVPTRNLNNPRYTDDLLRSKGVDPNSAMSRGGDDFIIPEEDRLSRKPDVRSKGGDVFDKFKQEY